MTHSGGGGGNTIVIDGGFVEVFDNHVRVPADHAEAAQDVDTGKARQQLEEANRKLGEAKDTAESEAAVRAMQQAQARLDASEHRS